MRLNRRASATTAMRRPRRAARRSAQARNVPLPLLFQQAHAAWISRLRSSPDPALVMWPRWRRSAELSSRGTSPRNALTWPACVNRSTSSSVARNVSATTGPTPGTVCSR